MNTQRIVLSPSPRVVDFSIDGERIEAGSAWIVTLTLGASTYLVAGRLVQDVAPRFGVHADVDGVHQHMGTRVEGDVRDALTAKAVEHIDGYVEWVYDQEHYRGE